LDQGQIPDKLPPVRTLLCTAEPFGYGPSSSLAQIVGQMRTLEVEVRASYAGSGRPPRRVRPDPDARGARRPREPLARLVVELGRGGARVVARAVDAWLRSLDEPRQRTRPLGSVPPPPGPRLVPLSVPRENRAGDEAIARMRALHVEVDGAGFHTLAAALEAARETRLRTPSPRARDFARALATWRASGLALWAKHRAGNCTALAAALRARVQRELGLSGQILCVRYADTKRPLEHDWE
jgi:hypothetical protein